MGSHLSDPPGTSYAKAVRRLTADWVPCYNMCEMMQIIYRHIADEFRTLIPCRPSPEGVRTRWGDILCPRHPQKDFRAM